MTILQRLIAILALSLLAACGGGGSTNAGSPPFGSGSTPIGGGTGSGGGGTGTATGLQLSAQVSSSTLRFSGQPAVVTVTLRDSGGNPLAGQRVTFTSEGGNLVLGAPSALTDGQGRATVTVAPKNGSVNAADTVVATVTTADGKNVINTVAVQVVAELPLVVLTLSNSVVSDVDRATTRAFVRDAAGNPVVGTIVTFDSENGLGSFDRTTAVTDATGRAAVVLRPKTTNTNGADTVTASASVGGATSVAKSVVQFVDAAGGAAPVLQLGLSASSISSAAPATVTALLSNAAGQPVAGQVVTFSVVRGLARTNIGTALTDAEGRAVVVLSPAAAASAGADEITATTTYGGNELQATRGFQVQGTTVTLNAFTAENSPLSAYGQTTLTLNVAGASVTAPVSLTISSSCVSQNRATLSPSTITATSSTVTMQYRDNGCGSVQNSDQLLAVVTATGASRTLTLPIAAPGGSSIAFVNAAPEQIFLRGSGFAEASNVTFEVRDAAGNALPGVEVELRLQTGAGGVTMEGRGVESVSPPSANPVVLRSNAQGRVTARVNAGTLPTPVRVNARLRDLPSVSTVSSNLSVAIGLPSQLNFSLSQGTKNIEGYNRDGTANTYQIIAADRNGNPVPAGTAVNFVAEGGQVEASRQLQLVNGIARTVSQFVSSEPRPVDGRVTVVAYALGEESFIDLNGNNVYDAGEPFQDLGNIYKDRVFDGIFDPRDEEFIPLEINNAGACSAPSSPLLRLDASMPSVPGTCDGRWSGAGQVYVRRAVETVLSTSAARPLWAGLPGAAQIGGSCRGATMQIGPAASQTAVFTPVAFAAQNTAFANGIVYGGGTSGTLSFIAADANPGRAKPFEQWGAAEFDPVADYEQFPRLNPMAAGTTIGAASQTTGFDVKLTGGSPVPDTLEATNTGVTYTFTDPLVGSGTFTLTFTSPSGLATSFTVTVVRVAAPSGTTTCTLG